MALKDKADIVIDADRATVWRMFTDSNKLMKWQPTLKSCTRRSGTRGFPDAISDLVYDENGREVHMTETITARRELSFIGGTYESRWGTAVVFNLFEDLDHRRTRWVVNTSYSFKGFMKVLSIFMRPSILRRTETDMHRFKLLVETETAGASS